MSSETKKPKKKISSEEANPNFGGITTEQIMKEFFPSKIPKTPSPEPTGIKIEIKKTESSSDEDGAIANTTIPEAIAFFKNLVISEPLTPEQAEELKVIIQNNTQATGTPNTQATGTPDKVVQTPFTTASGNIIWMTTRAKAFHYFTDDDITKSKQYINANAKGELFEQCCEWYEDIYGKKHPKSPFK